MGDSYGLVRGHYCGFVIGYRWRAQWVGLGRFALPYLWSAIGLVPGTPTRGGFVLLRPFLRGGLMAKGVGQCPSKTTDRPAEARIPNPVYADRYLYTYSLPREFLIWH